jgi:type II secretory pathway component GspD/PulD (secretin)
LLSALLLSVSVGRAEDAKLVQRVYSVADLVIPIGGDTNAPPAPSTAWAASREGQPVITAGVRVVRSSPTHTLENRLIGTIMHTIAPKTWSERGGPGTIHYHPLTLSLVVNQTPEVQEQIEGLLAALRRQQEMEVAVEVKIIELGDDQYQSLTADGLLDDESSQGVKQVAHTERGGVAFLDDAGVRRLMENIQGDVRTNVVQAPKLTAFNGQTSQINIVDQQNFVTGLAIVHRDDHIEYQPRTENIALGTQMALRPIVSADRRFVQVRFAFLLTNLESEKVPLFPITTPVSPAKGDDPEAEPRTFTQYIQQPRISCLHMDRTIVVPDGGTAVLTGLKKKNKHRIAYQDSPLSKIPYIGQLFPQTECVLETSHLVVLVTPRIIQQEAEEKKPAKAAPTKTKICPCSRSDNRTPIQPPVGAGEKRVGEEPSDAMVLRSLPRTTSAPGVYEQSRDDIHIVKECIVDKLDAPRFFPLIGPAQLHHCHWKCTVYSHETIEGKYPVPFRRVQPRVDVVYIDTDHLHLCEAEEGR